MSAYFIARDAHPNPRWEERPYWRDWYGGVGPLRTLDRAEARLIHERDLGWLHATWPGAFELIPVQVTVTPENASCVS